MTKEELFEAYDKVCKECEELEARLEKAIELPCKVGDTVWWFIDCIAYIMPQKLVYYKLGQIEWEAMCEYGSFKCENIGDFIFLTKEEAEAKLKELQEKERIV